MSSPELFSQTQQKAPREQRIEQHQRSNVSARPRSNELPPEALQGNDGGVERITSCSRIITPARQLRHKEDILGQPSASDGRITGPRACPSAAATSCFTRGSICSVTVLPLPRPGFRCHLKFSSHSCCATLAAHSPPLTRTNARTEGRGEGRPAGAPAGHGDRVT